MTTHEKKALIKEFLDFMAQREEQLKNMTIHRTVEITYRADEIIGTQRGFQIGDVIDFTLTTGEEVSAMAMRQDEDGMLFVFVDCLKDEQPMNPTDTTNGDYDLSSLRKKLNTDILATFPAHIRCQLKPVYKDGDLLRLLSKAEVLGKDEGDDSADKQLIPMRQRKNRIAFRGKGTEEWEWYWLRDVVSAPRFAAVRGYGAAAYSAASSASIGVRPAFKI